jgi:hypothetical protein
MVEADVTMRERILKRIALLKRLNNGFSPTDKRWETARFLKGRNTAYYPEHKGTHYSRLEFSSLKDHDLLSVYTEIVRRSV